MFDQIVPRYSEPLKLGQATLQPVLQARDRPNGYKKWLAATRAQFMHVDDTLEIHIFTVPLETIIGDTIIPLMNAAARRRCSNNEQGGRGKSHVTYAFHLHSNLGRDLPTLC